MARLPNFLVIIRSEKLSGKGQGRGCLGVRKKERFVLGKRTFRSQKSKHFVLRIIVVGKDGAISEAEVIRGVSPELNEEALRVINSMPVWSPGKQRGKVVNVKYTVPVTFRLSGGKKKASSRIVQRQIKEVDTSGRVFTVVQQMPEFPGGQASLLKYLATRIKYPAIAQENGIQGRVSCSFVVDTDGSLKNIEVIRGIDPSLDREAVRVIREMPKWNPGVQNNMAVAVKYTVPVTFRLQ